MKRKSIILSLLAVVLVLGLSVGSAWSYFTDSATAEGSVSLSVKPSTGITEENGPGTKTIRIQNTGEVVPVWTRVRVYAPAVFGASAAGTNWTAASEWYEYGEVVDPNSQTEALTVSFKLPGVYDEKTGTGAQDGDELNVVVVYESVPVSYDANGSPEPANWND